MINFFEAAVVFLVLTNAASLLAFAGAKREPMFIERKLDLILDRSV